MNLGSFGSPARDQRWRTVRFAAIAGVGALAAMTFSPPPAEAWDTYSAYEVSHPPGDPRCRETDEEGCEEPVGNCQTCHGQFRATNEENSRPYLRDEYFSLADGKPWSVLYKEAEADEAEEEIGLHDIHRHVIVDEKGDERRCNVCHSEGYYPVYLSSSTGTASLEGISCAGCHGRAEDDGQEVEGSIWGAGYAAGLRQHHTNAGVNVCKTCHADADPARYTPVGEDVLPPYYLVSNDVFVNKPTDPCNQRGDENYAAGPKGLDNDGDGKYDKSDLDCQPVGPGNNNGKSGK